MGDASYAFLRPINIIEQDLAWDQVCPDLVLSHKSPTDEKGSGATVHHSRYGCAMVSAPKGNLNFEMQTRQCQLRNNTGVNIVTKI
jgi:hypothetical protein